MFFKGLDKNTIDILDKASAVEEKMLGGQMEEIEEIMEPMYPLLAKDLIKQRKRLGGKDLSRVKASFKSIPLQPYFEFCATFWHWVAQQFQTKIGDEHI